MTTRAVWGLRLKLFYHQIRHDGDKLWRRLYLRFSNKLYRKVYGYLQQQSSGRILIFELDIGILVHNHGLDCFSLSMDDEMNFWEPIKPLSWRTVERSLIQRRIALLTSMDKETRELGRLVSSVTL